MCVIVALAGVSVCLPASSVARVSTPATGFWESSSGPEPEAAASVVVRRQGGRTVLDAITAPASRCGNSNVFGDPVDMLSPFPPRKEGFFRVPVDRRGRFSRDLLAQTSNIGAVRGRFRGRRRRTAVLIVTHDDVGLCGESQEYTLQHVSRQPLRIGDWRGGRSDGGSVVLRVINAGREVFPFVISPSPVFRCVDGSSHQFASLSTDDAIGWIEPNGRFGVHNVVFDLDRLLTMEGRFEGQAANGVLRIAELPRDGHAACDTGNVAFQVRGGP